MIENECIYNKLIINGKTADTACFKNEFVYTGRSIYEVVRIIDGIPLFLEDHFERFIQSSLASNISVKFSLNELRFFISELVRINNAPIGNCKIVNNKNENGEENDYIYFIKHYYPDEILFNNGIPVLLFKAERANPNSKSVQFQLRKSIDEFREKNKILEVLLVNTKNCITEGSRSNLFLIKNEKIYTPPLHQVLPGVTRKHIIDLCYLLNIELIEKEIYIDELPAFESVFLTGTSIKVLPVHSIDNMLFTVKNKTIQIISEAYNERIRSYIEEKKRN